MGKFVGFIGTISGKVGTTVFSKGENGLSYGRAYQPVVNNPKTLLQEDQRAKMNLVGKMSSVTPKALLMGMTGANNRQRRSSFTRNLLNVATVDHSAPGSIVAKVDPEDVVFSKGPQVLNAELGTVQVTANSVTVPLTLSDASLAGKYGERVIVAVIDPQSKGGYSQVKYVDQLFLNTTAVQVSIGISEPLEENSLVCVYRAPFVLNEEGVRMHAESLTNDGTDITAQLTAGGNRYVQDWGQSVMAISRVFMNA